MSDQQQPGLIYEAIAKVQAEIGKRGIAKDRENSAQRFRFRGVDDVLNALNPIMSEHGIFLAPECLERIERDRVTKKTDDRGNTRESVMVSVSVRVRYRVYAKDGSYVEGCTYGEAFDSGDKATNKAMAASLKYFLFYLFLIPTEGSGDEDADASSHQVAAPAKPAAAKKPERADAEPFEFVEDALTAIAEAKNKHDTDRATARIHASIINNKLSKDELTKLREAMAKRIKELGSA